MKKIELEMSVEEFKSLSESGSGESRGIVDWDKVLNELNGRVVSFNLVKKKVKEEYGKRLYYSEWTGVIERRVDNKELEVESSKLLSGGRRRRFWLIRVL